LPHYLVTTATIAIIIILNPKADTPTIIVIITVFCVDQPNGDRVETTLNIFKLEPTRLGVYRINARNSVGVSEEKVMVRRRDRSTDSRRDSSAVSVKARSDYSNSRGNAHPGKIYTRVVYF